MTYRFLGLLFSMALCVLGVTGCASKQRPASMHAIAHATEHERVRLSYRTETDRLNLAAIPAALASQTTTHLNPHAVGLPAVTVSVLTIEYPHPEGLPEHARATVTFRPVSQQRALASPRFQLTGSLDSELRTPADVGPVEVWAIDVPQQQLEGILTQLKQDRFFKASKTLNAAAFLALQIDGVGFGKNYRALPELDAVILRARQLGRPAAGQHHQR